MVGRGGEGDSKQGSGEDDWGKEYFKFILERE